jgi:hypothetical protein
MQINQIISATREPDAAIKFELDVTTEGQQDVVSHVYREDDPYSGAVGIQLAEWIDANPDSIEPFVPLVPLTPEELRAQMEPVTPRQLRLALIRNGVNLLSVVAALDALPEGQAKQEAEVEWEYSTMFERNAAALLTIASAIGLTPEQIDTMWEVALTI